MTVFTPPEKRYAGYIFDCDGTLANSMPLHFHAWADTVTKYGGQMPEELFYALGGWPSNKTKSTERTNVSQSPFDAAMPVRAGGAALRRNLSSKIKAPAAGTALYEVICTEFMTA